MRPFVVQWLVAAGIASGTVPSSFIALASSTALRQPAAVVDGFLPGRRVLLDAHNAYPDRGRYADRIEVALGTGLPVAIEQDLAWCRGLNGGTLAPRVSHETTCDGREPTLEEYFFARIAPVMDSALASGALAGMAARHAEPRLQDQRARAPRGGVGAARQISALADDGGEDGRRIRGAACARTAAGADRIARPPGADLSHRRARRRAPAPLRRDSRRRSRRQDGSGAAARDAGDELSPLVESSVESRRARGTARGRPVDPGGRGAPDGDRAGRSRPRPLDPLLHAQRPDRRARRLDVQLQLWQPRRRGGALARGHRRGRGLRGDRSVRGLRRAAAAHRIFNPQSAIGNPQCRLFLLCPPRAWW